MSGVSAPDVLVVTLRDERAVGGRLAAVHELGCAELRAALQARGLRADQLVVREVTTTAALAAAVRLRGARLAVIAAGAVPALAAALARELDGGAVPQGVALLGEPAGPRWPRGAARVALDGAAAALAALAGAPQRAAPDAPPPSPWLLGLLPARAAAQVGVRADQPPERLTAELAWIERRSPIAQIVPLLGPEVWEDADRAAARLDAIERAALRYVRIAPRLDPRSASAAVAGALARAGAGAVVLVVDAAGSQPDAAPAAQLARAAAATDVHVELRLSGDPQRDEAWIAAVARAELAFDVHGDATTVVPELQRARSFPARAAAAADRPQRLRRALEGCAPAPSPVVAHAHDMLWAHPDDPCRHEDWLREVLGASSSLAVLRPGPRPAPVRAPAPLREVTTIGVEPAGPDGAATWHVEGEVWHVRPYGQAPAGEPMRPLVLTLERREDLAALVADADAVQTTGRPPPAAIHPAVTIAGLGTLSADDPGPRLAQLIVDEHGTVRSAPAAHPLGRLGEPFDALRARAFERRDRQDVLAAGRGAVAAPSLPAWLGDDEAVSLLAARPHVRVLAHLPRALRALAGRGAPPPHDVRVGGLGGALLYDGPADPRRPLRRLVLAVDERYAIYDLRARRSLVVGRDLAAICEGLHATGDAATVAGWLAAARGLSAQAAGRAVSTAVARLQSVGLLDPAELVAAPAAAHAPARGVGSAVAPAGEAAAGRAAVSAGDRAPTGGARP